MFTFFVLTLQNYDMFDRWMNYFFYLCIEIIYYKSFKIQVSGFKIQVSGFKIQVSK